MNAQDLDPTFRKYTSEEASAYSAGRSSPYSASLYEQIIHYHASNGNANDFKTLLDIGCGPGSVTRALAPYFDHATGMDPGGEMIAVASANGGYTKIGEGIEFEVIGAEQLSTAKSVQTGEVDMLTAGMAAHWFNMEEFWAQATLMLKPGGTVALWTTSSLYCRKTSNLFVGEIDKQADPPTPNATQVQLALSNLEDNILGPYEIPSNALSRGMYDNLPLPWTITPPVPGFSSNHFLRHEWNRNGVLAPGESDFFGGSDESSLGVLEKALGTTSMVSRWRKAHPELANTSNDCVSVTMRNVASAMDLAEDDRTGKLRTSSATVLLLFTKVET